MNFSEKIIIALDFSDREVALSWVDQLLPRVDTFKVGLELFTKEGPSIVREIHKRGGKVFLDLKLHDIPNTVAKACASLSSLNVFMLNVHCSGGLEMMKAAKQSLKEKKSEALLIGVTVLTSIPSSEASPTSIVELALKAEEAGLNGVVCSVREVKAIKSKLGEKFITVTPGIRLEGAEVVQDDQKRSSSIQEALLSGSDFLVLGRSLFQSKDPLKLLKSTLEKFEI